MTQQEMQASIQAALDTFGAGFATSTIEGDLIVIRNKKGRTMGSVNTVGVIDRKYVGNQTLMGAIVRDKIAAALK